MPLSTVASFLRPDSAEVEIDHAKLHDHARTDEIDYVIGGSGTMVLDDEEIELHEGVVVYIHTSSIVSEKQADATFTLDLLPENRRA